ncbi:hypothetical protein KIH74_34405 [Kineosporia sp. J2-2]|uniref:Uncharacterized protein n=1 Tax=Kineosporia corallincola TaxID=2835133 RepID=A0ABS5TTG3_9ACTN|nr:DUF6345 domain-containing protein [Kineosporia corallincola]MBT0774089.1 hypothetical protein [Kineosporia corallincola]
MSSTTRRARGRALTVTLAAATTGAVLMPLSGGASAQARPLGAAIVPTATVYQVVQEGLTATDAETLARTAGIGNALRPDGSFSYTDPERFARVPTSFLREGKDESGLPTASESVDFAALARIKAPSDDVALRRAKEVLPVPKGYGAQTVIGHTTVDHRATREKTTRSYQIDTTVSYQLTLGGIPVVGPGAKARASFAGDGTVIQLSQAVRQVEASGQVPIVSPATAQKSCTALYGDAVKQDTPVLGYYASALGATEADGKGTVTKLVPHYICRPTGAIEQDSRYGGKLVAAAPALAPTVTLKASGDGTTVSAAAGVRGGTAPYAYRWASSSVQLDGEKPEIAYTPAQRDRLTRSSVEALTVTVTDADGLTSTARVSLANAKGDASATGVQGGAGGTFATNGIEQTVDEWQCAQDSANGFRSVIKAHNHTVSFDWRGASAFEKDFKDKNQKGWDADYTDKVDAQWYTGHGGPGGFTFKGAHDDGNITPDDARWGDDQLEWLQLESCQVLRDTDGTLDYFDRWGKAFRGLHLLNGFDTNAQCVNGGTGARFASYLFPEKFLWWELRPALTVQQAWGSMANDLEPAGRRWRSVSPATYDDTAKKWITNIGDHYWGEGSVGPDIRPGSATTPLEGFVSVSGVS